MEEIKINLDNFSLQMGKIVIYLPDYFSNYYSIFQDLTSILKQESNYECEKIITNKFNFNKKIKADSEADNVFIQTRDPKVIIDIAVYLNKQIGITFSNAEIVEYENIIKKWKKPKKQKWKEGDLFSIQLKNGGYAFGQIIEDYGGLPICLLFNGTYSEAPSLDTILQCDPLAILMITIDDLINHNYKILYNSKPVLRVPIPKKRDKIRTFTFASSDLKIIAEANIGLSPWDNTFDDTLVTNIFK